MVDSMFCVRPGYQGLRSPNIASSLDTLYLQFDLRVDLVHQLPNSVGHFL
jgi:hypothetical protein